MTTVDLLFPLTGSAVPADHGYLLYAAITSKVPRMHGARWFGVHPIGGRAGGQRLLLSRTSSVGLRLPVERIPEVLELAGVRLRLGQFGVVLGAPAIHPLVRSPSVDARTVLLKLTHPPERVEAEGEEKLRAFEERYRKELGRQLDGLGIAGDVDLCGRRTISIKGKRLIGFSVRVSGLTEENSLRLQERGLGGRRVLGCGVFRPSRGTSTIVGSQDGSKPDHGGR